MSDLTPVVKFAPWNASWTAEERYEIRPCQYAGGKLAIWSPYKPGEGKPVFAKPHMVRQRQSVARFVCTVCGKPTPEDDRYWFGLGEIREGYFMTTEAPVHRECAEHSLKVCPHLRGRARDLSRFPSGYRVLASIIGGAAVENDFGVRLQNFGTVIGHLKFAWPEARARSGSLQVAHDAVIYV
jgi:hypothetical protein